MLLCGFRKGAVQRENNTRARTFFCVRKPASGVREPAFCGSFALKFGRRKSFFEVSCPLRKSVFAFNSETRICWSIFYLLRLLWWKRRLWNIFCRGLVSLGGTIIFLPTKRQAASGFVYSRTNNVFTAKETSGKRVKYQQSSSKSCFHLSVCFS